MSNRTADSQTAKSNDAKSNDAKAGIDDPKGDPAPNTNTVKDPDNWTTGDEPMTGAQASYLKTLTEQTGGSYEGNLTKGEASKRIDALRQEAGLAKG